MQNSGSYHLGWRKEKTIFGPLCEKLFFCHLKIMWNQFIALGYYLKNRLFTKIKTDSPKLISRKICVTENLSNVHTVKSKYLL